MPIGDSRIEEKMNMNLIEKKLMVKRDLSKRGQ